MKKLLQIIICCLMVTTVNAAKPITSSEKPVGHPLYHDLDVKWVILNNVKYENKLFYACTTYLVFNKTECEKNGYTALEVLNKILGNGQYTPVGLSPYIGNSGNQLGIVLYYK